MVEAVQKVGAATGEGSGNAPPMASLPQPLRLDGKAEALAVEVDLRARVLQCKGAGVEPRLAVLLAGEDEASQVYVAAKERAASRVGIGTVDVRVPSEGITTARLVEAVLAFAQDPEIDGILVQLPLPRAVDPQIVLETVPPALDVDGFAAENLGLLALGRPRFVACTPLGCMKLLARAGTQLAGARALVIGRSNTVGKPMALLLLQANATVTVAHSKSRDLETLVREAEVVIVAAGVRGLVKSEWLAPGATVLDVGIHRGEDGKLYGDLDVSAGLAQVAAYSPVPGGVGPMTIACLLENVVKAAELRAGLRDHDSQT